MNLKNSCLAYLLIIFISTSCNPSEKKPETATKSQKPDDGYKLWLKYNPVQDKNLINRYKDQLKHISIASGSATFKAAKKEIEKGLEGLLETKLIFTDEKQASLVIGTPEKSDFIATHLKDTLDNLGNEGFAIKNIENKLVVAGNTDIGTLYGVFDLLRKIKNRQNLQNITVAEKPKIDYRLLNHWDNLDRSVERGYAGQSIWTWFELPERVSPRYKDYARANASLGINGVVLNNVNADPLILTEKFLKKMKAIAGELRPYGIKVYLSADFSAPMQIDSLSTADPLNDSVQTWWKKKADQIYKHIPDFGGFLVKADSEGQPGPHQYGRNHAEGANMLARALKPHGGIVMWRAFVYSNEIPTDRAKQAYNEFKPLDGEFEDNVLLQAKNGPIDFQPREPFHPVFGGLPKTQTMMELQITQEYLGQGIHLTYLAPLYKEVLNADTYVKGKGSEVSKVVDGSLHGYDKTGIAGVSNAGSDRNWCGHPFAQANWYAFGRLAWNHSLSAEAIAREWINMTFDVDKKAAETIMDIMMKSREAGVNYRTPLGLHHLMAWHHHYGPGPWIDEGRADWTAVYYHKADSTGIGFDRSPGGSNAVAQYAKEVAKQFGNIDSCPEKLLLWFHHVPWDHKMNSGRTLWEALCHKYYKGVRSVKAMQKQWNTLEGQVNPRTFNHVQSLMKAQYKDAKFWRDACVLYFQTHSNKSIPDQYKKPDKPLKYYINHEYHYPPGS